jgi:hypothetical protein
MLGFYENFPQTIHRTETFASLLTKRRLQQELTKTIQRINRKTLHFEEVGNPTVPKCDVIFEFGIADAAGFTYIDEEEARKMLNVIANEPFNTMDFFCAIRYYRNAAGKKIPLKFDYYLMRIGFGAGNTVEFQVFHERGPRYILPEDLFAFLVRKVNETSAKRILKTFEPN